MKNHFLFPVIGILMFANTAQAVLEVPQKVLDELGAALRKEIMKLPINKSDASNIDTDLFYTLKYNNITVSKMFYLDDGTIAEFQVIAYPNHKNGIAVRDMSKFSLQTSLCLEKEYLNSIYMTHGCFTNKPLFGEKICYVVMTKNDVRIEDIYNKKMDPSMASWVTTGKINRFFKKPENK